MHRLYALQEPKKMTLEHSIFIISSCHFMLCAMKKMNDILACFYG